MQNADGFNYEQYKKYINFINECRNKKYDDDVVLHTHHIIPRHICAEIDILNSNDNKIKLSVEDHVQAHLLFANLYPEETYEHISNLRSARILNSKSIRDVQTLNRIKKTYSGKNNPFYGKTHSLEVRKKIGIRNKNRTGKTYEEIYGEEKALLEKNKRAKKTRTTEQYKIAAKKAVNTVKERGSLAGKNNPYAQPYMIDGKFFSTRKEAEKYFDMAFVTIQKRYNVIKLKREK